MDRETAYDSRGALFTADVRMDEDTYEMMNEAFGRHMSNVMKNENSNLAISTFDLYVQFTDQYSRMPFDEYPEDGVFFEFEMDGRQYGDFTDVMRRHVDMLMSIQYLEEAEKMFEVWASISRQVQHQVDEEFDEELTSFEFQGGRLEHEEEDDDPFDQPGYQASLPSLFDGTTAGSVAGEGESEDDPSSSEDDVDQTTCTCCESDECIVTDFVVGDVVRKSVDGISWYECLTCGDDYDSETGARNHHCY